MKRLLTLLLALLMVLSLFGCAAEDGPATDEGTAQTGADEQQTNAPTDPTAPTGSVRPTVTRAEYRAGINRASVEALVTTSSPEGTRFSDRYVAVNSYGEPMFSVTEEHALEFGSRTLMTYVDMFYKYGPDSMEQYSIVSVDEDMCTFMVAAVDYGMQLRQCGFFYADFQQPLKEKGNEINIVLQVVDHYEDRTDEEGDYVYVHGSVINEEGAWTVSDGYSEIRYLDQGGTQSSSSYDRSGKLTRHTERDYDEYGETAEVRYFNVETGEVDGVNSNITEYDQYGGKVNRVALYNGRETHRYQYQRMNMDEILEEQLHNPIVGYWVSEVDGREEFIVISMNGMLCSGVIDPVHGLYLVREFAFYTMEEENVLHCAYSRNFYTAEYDPSWTADIPCELKGDTLILDGVSYQRAD